MTEGGETTEMPIRAAYRWSIELKMSPPDPDLLEVVERRIASVLAPMPESESQYTIALTEEK